MNMLRVDGFGAAAESGRTKAQGLDSGTKQSIITLTQDLLDSNFHYDRPVQLVEIEDKIRHASHPIRELQSDLIRYLITHPEAINEPIAHYVSAGDFAVQKGLGKLYRVLTRFPGFDYDKPDGQGNTQLHHAAALLNEEIVDHIITMLHGHSKPNRSGESPLDYVQHYGARDDHSRWQAMIQKLVGAGVLALNPSAD